LWGRAVWYLVNVHEVVGSNPTPPNQQLKRDKIMKLSFDKKYKYSCKTKLAIIQHEDKIIRGLGYFSSDIAIKLKDFANSLNW